MKSFEQLAHAIGRAIDAEGRISGRYSTVEIAECLARMAASAAALCSPQRPSSGVVFVVDTFLDEIKHQCEKHGIEGFSVELMHQNNKGVVQ